MKHNLLTRVLEMLLASEIRNIIANVDVIPF